MNQQTLIPRYLNRKITQHGYSIDRYHTVAYALSS
jgi:hypothetical protein